MSAYDPENIFARILRGELPSTRVHEDERCVAILDLFPVNAGHCLVLTRRPAALVADLPADDLAHLWVVGARLAQALRQAAPRCEGVNFWISDGAAAGQEVPHVHLHVIPRFAGDGFGWKAGPQNRLRQEPAALEAQAQRIRAALGGA